MVTVTCRCGENTYTFQHLTAADFPKGVVEDCCRKAVPETPAALPIKEAPVLSALDKAIIEGLREPFVSEDNKKKWSRKGKA